MALPARSLAIVPPDTAPSPAGGVTGWSGCTAPPRRQVEAAFRSLFRVLPTPLVAATRAGCAPGTFGAWVAAVAAVAARPGAPVVVGHSPLYRVVEVDPWSRIPERRHALLPFDP